MVSTRAYRAHTKGTNTIGSADIKQVCIGGHRGIAITPDGAEEGTGGYG